MPAGGNKSWSRLRNLAVSRRARRRQSASLPKSMRGRRRSLSEQQPAIIFCDESVFCLVIWGPLLYLADIFPFRWVCFVCSVHLGTWWLLGFGETWRRDCMLGIVTVAFQSFISRCSIAWAGMLVGLACFSKLRPHDLFCLAFRFLLVSLFSLVSWLFFISTI